MAWRESWLGDGRGKRRERAHGGVEATWANSASTQLGPVFFVWGLGVCQSENIRINTLLGALLVMLKSNATSNMEQEDTFSGDIMSYEEDGYRGNDFLLFLFFSPSETRRCSLRQRRQRGSRPPPPRTKRPGPRPAPGRGLRRAPGRPRTRSQVRPAGRRGDQRLLVRHACPGRAACLAERPPCVMRHARSTRL